MKPEQFVSMLLYYLLFAIALVIAVLFVNDAGGVYELSIVSLFLLALLAYTNRRAILAFVFRSKIEKEKAARPKNLKLTMEEIKEAERLAAERKRQQAAE